MQAKCRRALAIALLAAALLALNTLSACSAPARETVTVATPSATPTATPAPTASPTAQPDPYAQTLDLYREGIAQGWDAEQYAANELCYLCGLETAQDALGWCETDLNGDGVTELIVGNGSVIYDLYTLSDGQPVLVLSGGERNAYFILEDGRILNQGSSSAASSFTACFRLEGTELVPEKSVIFDTGSWYLGVDPSDPALGEPVEESQAQAIQAEWTPIVPEYAPLEAEN